MPRLELCRYRRQGAPRGQLADGVVLNVVLGDGRRIPIEKFDTAMEASSEKLHLERVGSVTVAGNIYLLEDPLEAARVGGWEER